MKRPRIGAAVSLLLIGATVIVACGDDEGNTPRSTRDDDGTPVVVLSTFTPVPPNFTPEVLQTRAAAQTAAVMTATAQPPTTATVPPAVTIPSGPVPTVAANEIRPPDAVLQVLASSGTGSIGSYSWFDPDLGSGADITAPYVILPEQTVTWSGSPVAQISVPSAAFPVTSADIRIFSLAENTVIPTTQQGQVSSRLAFYATTAPLQQLTVQGAVITFTPSVPPGEYVIEVRIHFETPEGLQFPNQTQNVFTAVVT